jgi:PmbA protein
VSAAQEEYRELAASVIKAAKSAGARDALLHLTRSEFCEAGFRDGSLEKASASTKLDMSLRLFVDGRFGVHHTNDLRPEELRRFSKKAVKLTRVMEPDPDRALPGKDLVAIAPGPELNLFDEAMAQAPARHWIDMARAAEREINRRANEEEANLVSSQGGAYGESSWDLLMASNGFSGEMTESMGYVMGNAVFLDHEDQSKRRQGWWASLSRELKDLGSDEQLAELADNAVSRALWQMGAKPGPTGRFPIVVENRCAGNLVRQWQQALSGQAIYHKRSYLAGRSGEMVASSLLSLQDVPLMPGGLSSRWYDSEGMAAREMPLIAGGELKNFYLDTYHARKLGMRPTTGSVSNLLMPASLEAGAGELCSGLDDGLLITGFLGGNFNPTSGDFSYGVSGQWFKNGVRNKAIEGMNLSGKAQDFWQELSAVGNEPFELSAVRTPSLRFEGAMLSGL